MKITAFRLTDRYNSSLRKEAQEIAFNYGYSYNGGDITLRLSSSIIVYLFISYKSDSQDKNIIKKVSCLVSSRNYNDTFLINFLMDVYNYYYDEIQLSDITIIDDDLKKLEKTLNDKVPNYNTPNKLIYEANENDNYNRIAIKIDSEDDFKILHDIIKDNSTELDAEEIYYFIKLAYIYPFVFYIRFKHLLTYNYGWDAYISVKNMLDSNSFYSNCYNHIFDLKNTSDIKSIINTIRNKKLTLINKPDYNKPKELVYENFDHSIYHTIIVQINSNEDVKGLAKIVKENTEYDYTDILQYMQWNTSFPYVFYISFKEFTLGWDRLITIQRKIEENDVYTRVYEKIFKLDNPSDVKSIIETFKNKKLTLINIPDYNTPKKLVYEKKKSIYKTIKEFKKITKK